MPKIKGLNVRELKKKFDQFIGKLPPFFRNPFKVFILCLELFIIFSIIYFYYLFSTISEHFEGRRWDIPSRVYSDTYTLYPGLNIIQSGFKNRLRRLSYVEVDRPVRNPGEYYFEDKDILDVYFHAFDYPNLRVPSRPIRLQLEGGVISKIQKIPSGEEIFTEKLEPERVAEFFGKAREERLLVRIKDIPQYLPQAIVAVEDRRFYEHRGIDPRAIGRAFLVNLRSGGISQGGSTLTQQLVKNFFLTSERSYIRKFNEAMMALIVEARYKKDEIMEAYLNEVYLGQRGSVAIHGVGEAAKYYFGKEASRLDLGECAMLAALLKGPAVYSPYRNKEKALNRRKIVLNLMLESNFINEQELDEAISQPLPLKRPYVPGSGSSYFVDLVRRQILTFYPEDRLTWEGLSIYTSIDVEMQEIINKQLNNYLKRLERDYPHLNREEEPLQGSFILVQPQTGFILALSGGRDFKQSQFNRAIQAKRQAGSLFKPLVVLTAFMSKNDDGENYTPLTLLEDEPITMKIPGVEEPWSPQNYDKKFRGQVTLRQALEQSINIPMINLSQKVGISRIADTARLLGIESEIKEVPSLALGTSEVTPFELAVVFSTIANLGVKPELVSLRDVVTQDGLVLERRRLALKEVIPPSVAYLTLQMMVGAVESGTGRGIKGYGINQSIAGKTGTTSDYRDAWFVGITPDLLGIAWVGFDDNQSMNISGARGALPIWAGSMRNILSSRPEQPFIDPQGIVRVVLDKETKEKITSKCPEESYMEEIFIENTEPNKFCHLHPVEEKEKKSFWEKVF